MKVAIVYESMFGNTEALGGEVLNGLDDAGAEVVMSEVSATTVQQVAGCDLVVLAAPTHALALSRPESRADAASRGAAVSHTGTGLREWLVALDESCRSATPRPAFAVFDTRMAKVRHWPGSASRQAARILRKQGFTVLDRASFYVDGIQGPITGGERERARQWGLTLAGLARPSASTLRHS